jgi:hypothetical protein
LKGAQKAAAAIIQAQERDSQLKNDARYHPGPQVTTEQFVQHAERVFVGRIQYRLSSIAEQLDGIASAFREFVSESQQHGGWSSYPPEAVSELFSKKGPAGGSSAQK